MKSKKTKPGTLVTVGIVALVLILVFFAGGIKAETDEDSIKLSATLAGSSDIMYDDIISVQLRDELNAGVRVFGIGSEKISAGSFSNDEFGSYKLYSYTRVKKYIVINTADGYFVYNLENEEKTCEAYRELLSRTETPE